MKLLLHIKQKKFNKLAEMIFASILYFILLNNISKGKQKLVLLAGVAGVYVCHCTYETWKLNPLEENMCIPGETTHKIYTAHIWLGTSGHVMRWMSR